jgi:hypothetical protein
VVIECSNSCKGPVTIYTNAAGQYSINLPPNRYNITVGPISYQGNQITFPTKQADIRSRDTIQNFVYHSNPDVEITGFGPYTDSEGWTIIEQFKPYTIGINVFEPYIAPDGDTVRCRVDTGNIIILDDLSDKGLDTLVLSDTTTYYSFRAGLANITGGVGVAHPYQKLFQAQFIKEGTPSTAEKWVYVVGQRPRKTAFTTTTPEIPLLILRDPPGDNSYCFFSQTTEVSQAISLGIRRNASTTVYEKLSLGLDFTFSTGWIFEVETEINVTLDFTAEMSMSMTQNSVKENQLTFITNNGFQTSADEAAIGQPGDLYVGGAMNILYGITDILTITNHVVNIHQDIIMAPKGFATKYTYTESHIVNHIIPSLYLIGDVASAHRWETIVARNQILKNDAQFVENRSISGLVQYSDSYTMTKTSTETQEFELVIDESVALDAGIEISGIGFSGGVKLATSYTSGKSMVNTTVNSTTTGYVLMDNDDGDDFTIDVKNDKVYGTPVFVTKSGQSSCPYEPVTVPREECSITPSVSSQSGVNPSGPAIFSVNLNNTSQTNEAGSYQLRVLNSTNPHGASIMAGGQSLSSPLIYTLEAYSALSVTIYISMPPGGQVYDFTGIQIVLESVCDPSVGDTATFDVHFIPPCSPVSIFSPGDNWVVNQTSNHILPVTITGYDTTNTQLVAIALEYSANSGNTWTEVTSIPRASIHASYLQYNWNVAGFNEYLNYSIRAVAKCGGTTKNYSASLSGIIDTHPPVVLGTPEPADGTLSAGNTISCTFNEPLNPASVTINSCQLIDAETGNQVSASVQYSASSNTGMIIFTISPGLNYYVENRHLTAQVTGVTDLHGNILTNTVNWDFLVDRGPLHWTTNSFQFIVESDTSFFFDSYLNNNSANQVNYSVLTPGSITATPYSGVLSAATGQTEVNFTTQPMSPGNPHYDTISASTLGYPEEKIYVSYYTPGFVQLEVDSLIRHVSAAAGTAMFIVTSNLAWSVTEGESWLEAAPRVGYNTDTIFVSYDANTAYTQRTAVINIKAEGILPLLSLNVNVIQAGSASPLPVSVAINADANPVCAGTPVTFTATPVNGGTTPQYQWKKGNVAIAGATNATYSYAPANGDAITCMMTSSASNTTGSPATSNTITMTVNPLLPVSITITASANNVTTGTAVTFTAVTVNGGEVPVYQWIVNGGVVPGATGSAYSYFPVNNDQVRCEMSSSATCVTGNPATSNMITMVVSSFPVTLNVGNATAASGQTLCYNAQQTITVAGNSTTFTVENLGTANFIAGQAIYFKPGTTVFSGGNLTGKIAPNGPWCSSLKITDGMAEVPNPTDPDGKSLFNVYPNPTNGNFTIAQNGNQPREFAKIEVYSMTGEKVASDEMTSRNHEVEFRRMLPGLYFLRIVTSTGSESFKLIKTR